MLLYTFKKQPFQTGSKISKNAFNHFTYVLSLHIYFAHMWIRELLEKLIVA
jgi:hypothetical protein